MKSFVWVLFAAVLGLASADVTWRSLRNFEYFGEDLDPQVVDFPLSECQGACLKDSHVSDGRQRIKFDAISEKANVVP